MDTRVARHDADAARVDVVGIGLLDIGDAGPDWLGPFDFIAITIGAALLGWLLWRAVEDARAMPAAPRRESL
jgi:hypothetical protein